MSLETHKKSKYQFITAGFVLLVGVCVSIFVYNLLKTFEKNHIQNKFALHADAQRKNMEEKLEIITNTLASLNAFYKSSKYVDRTEFKEFTAPLLNRHPSIQALEWAPYVPYDMRENYEDKARDDGHKLYQFLALSKEKELITAPLKESYFPIFYLEPLKGNEKALGFDLTSNIHRKKTIQTAINTGNQIATPPIQLVQDKKQQASFLIVQSVYSNDIPEFPTVVDRKKYIKGVLLVVIRINGIIGQTFNPQNHRHILITDVTDPKTPISIVPRPEHSHDSVLTDTNYITVAGRKWKVSLTAINHDAHNSENNFNLILCVLLGVTLLFAISIFTQKSKIHILLVQASFTLLTIILCISLFLSMRTYFRISSLSQEQSKLESLTKDLSYFDEVLTMSARLAVVRHDLNWEKRYKSAIPKMEQAIDQSLKVSNSPFILQLIEKLSLTNDKLVEMEVEAFNFAHMKEWDKADKILYSPKYILYKTEYQKNLQYIISFLEQRLTENRANEDIMLRYDIYLSIMMLITIIGTGLFMSWVLHRWHKSENNARSELKYANTELEEFAYRTSHDLRSPLVSSIALLNIVESSVEDNNKDQALTSLSHIRNSLSKLESLVTDILALTQTKSVKETDQPIDIEDIIENTLKKLSHMDHFDRLSIHTQFRFHEKITGKKDRFILIIENLISNAIKYQDMKKKKSFLEISTYQEQGHFILSVKDNGISIPKDKQNELFKMFKRFHPKVSFGSGLGLYMVKKSADIIGATLTFEDKDDTSCFKIILPLSTIN